MVLRGEVPYSLIFVRNQDLADSALKIVFMKAEKSRQAPSSTKTTMTEQHVTFGNSSISQKYKKATPFAPGQPLMKVI